MILTRNSKIKLKILILITIFSLIFPAYAEYNVDTGDSNDPYRSTTGQFNVSSEQLQIEKQKLEKELQVMKQGKEAEVQAEQMLITAAFIDNDLVLEVFPFISKQAGISIIPDESIVGLLNCELREVPLDRALEIILTGTPYTYKKTPNGYFVYTPEKNAAKPTVVDLTSGPAKQSLSFKLGTRGDIDVKKDNDGKYVATTEIKVVLKTAPNKPFVVRNRLGNIFLKPSKNGTCEVKAVIKGKAETDGKACSMAGLVLMNLDSTEKRYYLNPIKQNGSKWNNLSIAFHITVPAVEILDVKTDLGNIEISNLKENIKAVTDLGSIKAVNTTGNVELFTKMGSIEFIAPKNLSAKFNIQNKMGSIESELPLQVSKPDMFKRTAEGTIGTGQANIKMATDMGKINLKWLPSPQSETKL